MTNVGNNARMKPRRSKALWAVAALLLVNAVLLAAPVGYALPGTLGSYFFGPKLVRADVLSKTAAPSTSTGSTAASSAARPTGRWCCASATAVS